MPVSGNVSTAGGVLIAIGSSVAGSPPVVTLDEYEAESWVNIGQIEDGGQYGDEVAEINFTALEDGRVRKFKGPYNAGNQTVVTGASTTDEGQTALVAAVATKWDYMFRVTLNDATDEFGEPTISYFCAKVMSERRNIGTVMNVVKRNFILAIDTPITEVEATNS